MPSSQLWLASPVAIEYGLSVASESGVDRLRSVIAGRLDQVDWDAERVTAYRSTGGLLVTVREDREVDLVISEPTVHVGFRLDKFSDLGLQQDVMVGVVADVLAADGGDAVLHFQYETIWLLRRGSSLLLHADDELWPAHRVALVPGVTGRRAMSYPED